jgi:hypothetical protein
MSKESNRHKKSRNAQKQKQGEADKSQDRLTKRAHHISHLAEGENQKSIDTRDNRHQNQEAPESRGTRIKRHQKQERPEPGDARTRRHQNQEAPEPRETRTRRCHKQEAPEPGETRTRRSKARL